jgi:SRSO17 transposase
MQHPLSRAGWDADAVRDDLRAYVVEYLHDDQAVLVVDETGDAKKGSHTVGIQRHYTGAAGRIENSQVAVYPAYAGRRGHAPRSPRYWAPDRQPARLRVSEQAARLNTAAQQPGRADQLDRQCEDVSSG